MTERHLLETVDGISEFLEFDDAADAITFRRISDVEPLIDENKRLATLNDGYSPSREWKRVASIPLNVVYLWTQKYGVDPTADGNEELLARLLADPEWRHLRTDGMKPSRVFWTSPTTFKPVEIAPPASPLILGA